MMMNENNIWLPVGEELDVESCGFYAVENSKSGIIDKETYGHLFFNKLINLMDDDIDESTIDLIECYYPSLAGSISENSNNVSVAEQLINAEEFYFSFPPIKGDSVEGNVISDFPKELKNEIEDAIGDYTLEEFLQFTDHFYSDYQSSNSEERYDMELSRKLMGIEP